MRIVHVVGARPNFMKVAPVMRALSERAFAEQRLVHTGQHYDAAMSDVFFKDLGLPKPDEYLGVGSGTHAEQTARVMVEFEKVCLRERPDLVVVAGDVNSTVACALDAAKLHIPCAHIEAGLRSNDWQMPEEVNRVVTDRLCHILLTPSPDGDENLLREGTPKERIFRVGNVMIDSLLANLPKARATRCAEAYGIGSEPYAVLTLHRPSNVDDPQALAGIATALEALQNDIQIVFPVHPRTRQRLEAMGLVARLEATGRVRLLPPLGYLEFTGLEADCRLMLTDSGGLQEETTALGIPCLTLRDNTERPVTITHGTNQLVGNDPERIVEAVRAALAGDGKAKQARIPDLWDGHAAERIADVFEQWWDDQPRLARPNPAERS